MQRNRTTEIDKRKRRSYFISIAIIATVAARVAYGVISDSAPNRQNSTSALSSNVMQRKVVVDTLVISWSIKSS